MSKTTLFSISLLLVTLTAGTARSQERLVPVLTPSFDPASNPAPAPEVVKPAVTTATLSDWITYHGCGCCGPVGGNGSIHSELYVRGGVSLPFGGGFFEDRLDTGWVIQGGLRSYFFDPAEIRAWTVDLSLSYSQNGGTGNQPTFIQNGIESTIRDLHRTAVTASLGKEYYLIGTSQSCDRHWRVGADAGIRWGTTRLDLNTFDVTPMGFRRVNSFHYGPVVAVHSDVELPMGCCKFVLGVRGEWVQVFSPGLVQEQNNQFMEWNALLTMGVRY